ncbi:MAG: hypothetical protein IJ438_04540 [Clostridia bacterium]|nr:hypothetical protein [Clostridia bacterium]
MRKMIFKWSYCLALLLLLGVLSALSAQAGMRDYTLNVSADKTSMNVGETLTINYALGGNYESMTCSNIEQRWRVMHDGKEYMYYAGKLIGETEGSVSFAPLFGDSITFIAYDGMYMWSESETVTLNDNGAYTPMTATFTLSRTNIVKGEEVTVKYEIVGGTDADNEFSFRYIYDDSEVDGRVIQPKAIELSGRSGEFTFIPDKFALPVDCYLILESADGYTHSTDPKRINVSAPAAKETDLVVSVEFDKETVEAGQPITATYKVTGGVGLGEVINATWRIKQGYERYDVADFVLTEREGTVTFVPEYGEEIYFIVTALDAEDTSLNSATAIITGYEELLAFVETAQTSVSVGTPIKVDYEVTGGTGKNLKIVAECTVTYQGNQYVETISLTDATGSFYYTPTYGESVSFDIIAADTSPEVAYGQRDWLNHTVAITGSPEVEKTPAATVTLDKESIEAGETITATYELSNIPDDCFPDYGYWRIDTADNLSSSVAVKIVSESGTVSYTPKYGETIQFSIFVSNYDDIYLNASDTASILNAPAVERVSINATTDKTACEAGDLIGLTYEITGGTGEWTYLYAYWKLKRAADGNWTNGTFDISDLTGTLYFKPAFSGEYTFGIVAADAFSSDRADFEFDVTPSTKPEEEPAPAVVPGDSNGDGTTNMRDALALLKKLAAWDVTIDQEASDVNGDGTVNMRDALLLLKYLAGWDVTLQ